MAQCLPPKYSPASKIYNFEPLLNFTPVSAKADLATAQQM